MRHIIKLPLQTDVLEQLKAKQQRVNNGEVKSKFDPSTKQRRVVTATLIEAQRKLCCYCECTISEFTSHSHIEHFREQSDYKDKIYDYDNFLLSCQGEIASNTIKMQCGHAKERSRHAYAPVDYHLMLNPMEDNTALFFYNASGIVESKTTDKADIERVGYTCNRLNLNNSGLVEKRVDAIERIEMALRDLSLNQQKELIKILLDENQAELEPFHSTIKDNFAFLLP